jgi:hypothetical protein
MAAEAPLFVGLTAVLLLAGAALAFWCVRTVQAERQRKAFDPQETAALEQAAASLIRQLKDAADEAVERVAQASHQLNRLIATAERRMETVWTQEWGQAAPPGQPAEAAQPTAERASVLDTDYMARTAEVYRLADEQLDEDAIADRTGFERAEVRVLLSLRQLGQQAG